MYKNPTQNQTQNNIQEKPYTSLLQKLRESKFVRGITLFTELVAGTIFAYRISKNIDSYIPAEITAAELPKNLNLSNTKKITQLYDERVSTHIKRMSDLEIRLTITDLANERGIKTDKSKRYQLSYASLLGEVNYFKDEGSWYKEVFIPESEGGGPGGSVEITEIPYQNK